MEKNDYENWEIEKLIDRALEKRLEKYDEDLWKKISDRFKIELSTLWTGYSIGKFVAVAVVLLIIGTAYQIFVSLAGGVK